MRWSVERLVGEVDRARCAPVLDLPGYFGGRWLMERDILTASGQWWGSFTGEARFTEESGVLVYREQGELVMGGHRGPASRCLHYRLNGPGRARVFFDYGDFFHDLDVRTGHGVARHPCSDDLYRGEYVVGDPGHWWQVWDVSGPTKNHRLVTAYHRDDSTVD